MKTNIQPFGRILFAVFAIFLIPLSAFSGPGQEIPPPDISTDLPETSYISPGMVDGIQDSLRFIATIQSSQRMVVKSYSLIVSDSSGSPVYTKTETYPTEEPFMERILIGVGFVSFKSGVEVPDLFTWDGADDSGNPVAEGTYTLVVQGTDDAGGSTTSDSYSIVVDNTAPTAQLVLPYTVFSPNNDGNQDILIIEQTADAELSWSGVLVDQAGKAQQRFSWKEKSPENITWNGQDLTGASASDGNYSYRITGTDRSGNTATVSSPAILIDTRDTPISVTRDLGYFSPNGDNSLDTLTFTPAIPVQEGIKSWQLDILKSKSQVVRTITGEDAVPQSITFDGKSESGATLSDGTYSASLAVLYTNGNNPSTDAPEFVVDLTPPNMSLRINPAIISPNGDGNQDTLEIYQEATEEDQWQGMLINSSNETVRTVTWRGIPEESVSWDGKDTSGALVANDRYRYVLQTTDRAGNFARVESQTFAIDVRETPVALTVQGSSFSPNVDGNKDTISVVPDVVDSNGLSALIVNFSDTDDKLIRSYRLSNIPDVVSWDGKDNNGRAAPDGTYSASIELEYANGNRPSAKAGPIVLDTAFPALDISVDNPFFSPDNDGNRDILLISQRNASDEQMWTATIKNPAGLSVRTFVWTGKPENLSWNGTDKDGNTLPDGSYRYVVRSTDDAGNAFETEIPGITIDTRETPVTVLISDPAFSPNDDGIQDLLTITPRLEVTENIVSWNLEILDAESNLWRKYTGGESIDAIEFDGLDGSGSSLAEDTYHAQFSVLYKNGNEPSARSGDFAVDVTVPRANVRTEGDIFSPNGDGNRDLLVLQQSGSAEAEWKGIISHNSGNPIRTVSWFENIAPRYEWDGKDDDGKLAADGEYVYFLMSTDRAGNYGISNQVMIQKDTRDTPLSLLAEFTQFSPNNDGKKDRIEISPQIGLTERISSYRFSVIDKNGNDVVIRTGFTAPPSDFSWDGKALNGRTVDDGIYRGKLELTYSHGNMPVALTPGFTLDTIAPSITASAEYTLFSPDGDGRKDGIAITQSSSREELWEGKVISADTRREVNSLYWRGNAIDFVWDGKDSEGNTVADGAYRYTISAVDEAGNSSTSTISGITIDTRNTSAYVNPSITAISPNGDGNLDTVSFNLYKSLSEGILSWQFSILNERGSAIRRLGGSRTGSIPQTISWNGKNDSGAVSDGNYQGELRIEYKKGNLVVAKTAKSILVDTTPPRFTFRVDPLPFSPDDDGVNDTVNLKIDNVDDASAINAWAIEIKDPKDNPFVSWSGRNISRSPIRWNGKSANGELVQAAEDYFAHISVTDNLGNVAIEKSVVPIDILVFRDGNRLKIRISSIQFAPNSSDFLRFDREKADKNMKTLRRLSQILQKYSDYQIKIEGHAVSVYWDNAERAKKEEDEELKPLSTARAEEVKKTLVDLGIPEGRMTAVGMGGTQPIVPHGDVENRWKSRRVEFILIK